MSIHCLISGTLYKDPQSRTSASGKPFCTAQLRTEQDGQSVWCSVICFDTAACEELMRCHAGDAVAAQGRLKISTYEKNGEVRPSLDITASSILPLKPKPRERKPRQARTGGREFDPRDLYGASGQHQADEDFFNDPCPI
ncbi:single-stranded DNA-binding protein [Methylococcus sp. ANG]|uniref:single-stranded DNA-binding protein n=1 Tax=Methylococcus sp. ANG TaxID=3231903 RepID=UPI003458CD45